MAHKNLTHLCHLISYFNNDCDVIVHIDKKSLITSEEIEKVRTLPQVKLVYQRYEVHWGGTSVLDCGMSLLEEAVRLCQTDYYHLLSGQDYPVRPLQDFLKFFEQNKGREYLQYYELPNKRWENGTFRRFQYYYPYDYDEGRGRGWVMGQVHMQYSKGIKRPIPDEFDHLYGNSQWFSITHHAAKILLNYTHEYPSLYNKMWMTFAPEETYVSTVLVNLLDKDKLASSNLRYIRWKNENGNCPANLGEEHFRYLLDGEYFFARKFEKDCSEGLVDLIDSYLHQEKKLETTNTGAWQYDGFLHYKYEDAFYQFVAQFCREVCVRTAIDMGCGAGHYVARWREDGLPFAGYDANPYTPKLSKILLKEEDTPCGVADLTEELDIPQPFDLVVCKDVLNYIPKTHHEVAVKNLASLSSHFILISLLEDTDETLRGTNCSMEDIVLLFEAYNFRFDRYFSARLHIALGRKDCGIFIKKGKAIIE